MEDDNWILEVCRDISVYAEDLKMPKLVVAMELAMDAARLEKHRRSASIRRMQKSVTVLQTDQALGNVLQFDRKKNSEPAFPK